MIKKINNTFSSEKFTLLITFFITIALFLSIPVSAGASVYCNICNKTHNYESELGFIQETCYEYSMLINGKNILSAVGTDDYNALEAVEFDITKRGGSTGRTYYGDLWDAAENLYNIVQPFGFILVTIYFCISLGYKVAGGNLSGEMMAKDFIKLLLGLVLILNAFDIITVVMQISTEVYKIIATYTEDSGFTICEYNEIKSTGDLYSVGRLLGSQLKYAFTNFVRIFVKVFCFIRTLEITLYTAFAPIGMSDIMSSGITGTGFTYLKRIFALALQGAVILGITASYSLIRGVILTSGGSIASFILACTVLGLIIKSKGIANQIVGV